MMCMEFTRMRSLRICKVLRNLMLPGRLRKPFGVMVVLLYFLTCSLKKPLSFPKDFSYQTFIRSVPDLF